MKQQNKKVNFDKSTNVVNKVPYFINNKKILSANQKEGSGSNEACEQEFIKEIRQRTSRERKNKIYWGNRGLVQEGDMR